MTLFRGRRAAALAVTAVLFGGVAAQAAPEGGSHGLADALRHAVDAQNFKDVIDLTPPVAGQSRRVPAAEKYDPTTMPVARRVFGPAVTPQPIHQTPNMDAAVIELDDAGRPTAMADVLLSPQYPHGVSVPLDQRRLATDQVRYRWWDDNEWDENGGKGTRDVLPGRERAALDFSSPYPASVLKLMVGFGIMRLSDQHRIDLDATYDYRPATINPVCGEATSEPIRQYFDEMITMSRNESTCALLKLLHDQKYVDTLNATFTRLGLPTLMITGTDPGNGGHWIGSNMSSIDTAKLLLIVNGGPGTLWTNADGSRVTRDVLSSSARQFYLKTLGNQGHNEMLSTTNWCGRAYPAPGIPQVTPQRWIDPTDGTMDVDGLYYGQDVRPCNASAEVTMAHKTGWVDTTGSDAAIVHSLPGKAKRNYIVVVFCNLGTDYVDVNRPADPPGVYPVPYTQKYAQLGKAIDGIVTSMRH
ncbi:serine hydrolase [Kutzneria kofuensis]|uniref:Beta-lactamase class A catalytic domain-containing protein n=1 Tax=Kutzneria kofuensis TaxID=103725 RepID=A0A7W9KAY4_9PSEU|nr:serine hydrolase [Kutzneria kofuensis]MBB5889166.1 hypothetical protein [Kutzneria kofuensis]